MRLLEIGGISHGQPFRRQTVMVLVYSLAMAQKTIYLRVPTALHDAIAALAKEYDVTMTAVCNRAIATYVAGVPGYSEAVGRGLP